jgi:hypothetical protein
MSACAVCPDKAGDGWKQSGVTHCPTCHTTWSQGTKITHCVTCHETFSTHSNSDRHQAGTKTDPGWRCRPPASVGLVLDDRLIWRMPGREDES